MLEVPRPDPVPVRLLPLARKVAEVVPPTTATLGLDTTGTPLLLRLDAPEVGPALIAGSSGAGKSSLLQALALSLALHNAPRDCACCCSICRDRRGAGSGAFRRGKGWKGYRTW